MEEDTERPKQMSELETQKRDEDNLGGGNENRYMLRKRLTPKTVINETDIRKRTRIASNFEGNTNIAPKSTTQKKSRAKLQLQERLLNQVPNKEYLPNEIILATIPGYVPWPARILEMTGQTVFVEFFGTGQKNIVRPTSIRHFDVKTVLPLLNRKGYKKAMIELELCLKIPSTLSVIS